jgi:hypothetical protein
MVNISSWVRESQVFLGGAGSNPILVTLEDDTWISTVASSNILAARLINAITADGTQMGWDNVIKPMILAAGASTAVSVCLELTFCLPYCSPCIYPRDPVFALCLPHVNPLSFALRR